jgi:predicted transcriptional regulator
MATNSTKGNRKQVGLNIRAALYDDLTKIAKDNGQTTTYLLEQAVEHYLRYIAPSQDTIRPEMMAHARKSIEFNRKLLELLTK